MKYKVGDSVVTSIVACIVIIILIIGGAIGYGFANHQNNKKEKEKEFYESIHVENPTDVINYMVLESYLTKRDACLKIGGTMNRVGEVGISMNGGATQWLQTGDYCEVGTTTKEWGTITAEKRGWK